MVSWLPLEGHFVQLLLYFCCDRNVYFHLCLLKNADLDL